MSKTFIFFDGPDGVGKSTLLSGIARSFPGIQISQQPNGEGPLGFIREIVKSQSFKTSDFARQLLHCCSHVYDYTSKAYSDSKVFVFDRSFLSTLVYGSVLVKDQVEYNILCDINLKLLYHLMEDNNIKVILVLLDRKEPLKEKDSSYYEEVTKFDKIRNTYLDCFSKIKNRGLISCHHVSVDSKDAETVLEEVKSTIFSEV